MRIRFIVLAALAGGALLALGAPAFAVTVDPLWQKEWRPPGSTFVSAAKVVRGPGGDLWVAGTCFTSRGDNDCFVARYRTNGSRRWAQTFDTPVLANQWVSDFAVDRLGNCVLAGYVAAGGQPDRLWIVKVNASGARVWTRTLKTALAYGNRANDVAVDASRNIYVAGYISRTTTNQDWALLKYSPTGELLWQRFKDAGLSSDTATSVVVDPEGRIFATGYLFTAATNDEVFTARYSPAGKPLWSRLWNSTAKAGGSDRGLALAVAGTNVAVAGSTVAANDHDWGLVLRYDLSGGLTLAWPAYIFGLTDLRWRTVAVNAAGQVAAAGEAASGTPGATTPCAASIGGTAGTGSVHESMDSFDRAAYVGVELTSAGRVYLTGTNGLAPWSCAETLAWLPGDNSVPWYSQVVGASGNVTGNGLELTSEAVYVAGTIDESVMLAKYAR